MKASLIHGNILLAFDDLSLGMTKGQDNGLLLVGSGWDGEGKTFGEVAGLKTGDLLHLCFKRLGTCVHSRMTGIFLEILARLQH